MNKVRTILRMSLDAKLSNRQIAKSLNISRTTVSEYVTRAETLGLTWERIHKYSEKYLEGKLNLQPQEPVSIYPQPDWGVVLIELKKKGATRIALHEEYLAVHPTGMSYSRFATLLREYVDTLKLSLRQEHVAGEKVFVDYAGPTIPIYEANKEPRSAQLFVGVLGASSYFYAEVSWSQKIADWIGSHVRMFEHFGGVPLMVVCDNLKSGVTKASRTDPTIQATYEDMASHYNTNIFPARALKPKDKAKAENGVLILERWIIFRIRNRIFTSLSELNQAIKELLVDINNRPFQKLPGSRQSIFDSVEKPALMPLSDSRYEPREFLKSLVPHDYHVKVYDHFYSVPYGLVRKTVQIILSAKNVEIFYDDQRVAQHTRDDRHGKTTDKSHKPANHAMFEDWDPATELSWAERVGPNTHILLEHVLNNVAHPNFGYRQSTAFRSLHSKFGDRLEAACRYAVERQLLDLKHLKSILKTKLDHSILRNDHVKQEASFEHMNIRGSRYYN